MHVAIGFLFLSCIGIAAQAPAGPGEIPVLVRTLTIVSNDASPELQQNIVRVYQGQTRPLEELEVSIRMGLRDMGYANARVEIPQLATMPVPSQGQPLDVSVQVFAGDIYKLTEIRFEGLSVFSADVLRSQFPIADGDIFKATSVTDGLNNLSALYMSQGYINLGAMPKVQYDDGKHTLALNIELDEGARYYFGRLSFDGPEPNQGVFSKLLSAWNSIEGKPYHYRLLENLLTANAMLLPGTAGSAERTAEKFVTAHQSDENHRVDIELRLP